MSSTLDELNEGAWVTENVLLLAANVAVAVGTTTLIMYLYVLRLPSFDSLSFIYII